MIAISIGLASPPVALCHKDQTWEVIYKSALEDKVCFGVILL